MSPRSLQLRQQLVVELVAGLGVDLAGLHVDDVLGEVAAGKSSSVTSSSFRPLLGELRGRRAVIFLPASTTTSPVLASIRSPAACCRASARARTACASRRLVALIGMLLVEGREDLLVVHAQRIKQRRHRQLAAPVDAHIDDVLGVELEVEPGAAIGNDAGGEQQLAGGMRLAAVVVEEHAGRTVHLRDDDALGAVDDEGAVRRHERHVAHVDVLLLDVLDRLGAGLLVHIEHDQAQLHLERRREGHVALLALVDVVFRRLELVAHELERRAAGEIRDREHRLEDGLQALVVRTAARGLLDHQEVVIGALLNLDEVRHLRDFADAIRISSGCACGR